MPTVIYGNFEWDEGKNTFNKQKHNIAFEEASGVFAGDFDEKMVYHELSQEIRLKAVGLWKGKEIVVISTERTGRRRIISARRAKDEERNAYRDRRRT